MQGKIKEEEIREKVLKIITKDLEKFNDNIKTVKKSEQQDLEVLKQMIKTKVQHYQKRHSKVYQFFSGLFYGGDVTKLSQDAFRYIEKLEKKTVSPSSDKKEEIKNFSANLDQKELNIPKSTKGFSVLSAITNEKNHSIKHQANELVNIFNEVVNKYIKEGLSFEDLQRLKEAKKQAKELSKNLTASKSTKKAMNQLIKQYDQIVESIEVLSLLRKISQELRGNGSGNLPARPLVTRFTKLINDDVTIRHDDAINDLVKAYKSDKKKWKENWTAIRKKIWNVSIESQSFITQGKKFTFITGSKSTSIPSILKIPILAPMLSDKPALVPTGKLLLHNIVPLAGELFMGITEQGINQIALSGMKFAGLDTCVAYATAKSFQFNADTELENIYNTKKLVTIFSLPTLRIALLRLLLMGEKKEEYPNIKDHIQKLILLENVNKPIKENWPHDASLIGLPCKIKGTKPKEGELSRGQVVAVPRSNSPVPKYGIIAEIYPSGDYRVIVEKDGTKKTIDPEHITVIDEKTLSQEAKNQEPLTQQDQLTMQKRLKNNKEQLEEILELFDTVKPFEHSQDELDLLNNPFPVVWASVSLESSSLSRSAITGEQFFKGHAALGDDIQYVFTNRENINHLQTILKEHNVQVMSFEAAYYIFRRNEKTHYQTVHE